MLGTGQVSGLGGSYDGIDAHTEAGTHNASGILLANTLLCPLTISLYVLSDDPEHVYLSWYRPVSLGDTESQAAVQEMVAMIEAFIRAASEW
ncbi:MAG: hypothetical protein ABF290_02555 [Thiogranum sp.]